MMHKYICEKCNKAKPCNIKRCREDCAKVCGKCARVRVGVGVRHTKEIVTPTREGYDIGIAYDSLESRKGVVKNGVANPVM